MPKTEVQAVLFDKKKWTTTQARTWIAKHDYKAIKRVDITKNLLRYRLKSPKKYKRFSIKSSTKGIKFVIGHL